MPGYYFCVVLAAVLISGGLPSSDVGNELYLPASGSSCKLPPLPDDRVGHTVERGGLLCGGENTRDTCLQWSSVTGTWEESVTLEVGRDYHVSWTPDPSIGTLLMGDWSGGRTTTLIRPDGAQEPGFTLKHDTRYAYIIFLFQSKLSSWSRSCAIEDPDTDTVVITGGYYTMATVSVYGLQGWLEDLSSLNIGRREHACTSFVSNGYRVKNR